MKKLVTVIVAIGMLGIGAFILKDTVSISPIETQKVVHPSEDVVNQFGQLSVNGFTWISEDVHWLGNDTIEFSGKRTSEESVFYKFDINTLEIQEVSDEKHMDNELVLYEDSDRLLYTDRVHDGLFLKTGENIKALVEDQEFLTSKDFVLSHNHGKVGYLNKSKKTYMTYDVSSGKFSTMAYNKGAFETVKASDQIEFSNDGGFISFEDKTELLTDNRFSILGADSGRFYGKAIKGMNPEFSTDSKTVAFIYNDALKQDYSGAKIGVFILKYKKIIYLDTLLETEILYPELAWSEDGTKIYAITKNHEGQSALTAFNIKDGSRKGIALADTIDINKVKEIEIVNNTAYIVFNTGDLAVVDMESGRYNSYEGLRLLPNDRYLKKINDNTFIVHTENELWSLTNDGHRVLSKYEGQVKGLYLSENNDKLAMLIDNAGHVHIQVSSVSEGL